MHPSINAARSSLTLGTRCGVEGGEGQHVLLDAIPSRSGFLMKGQVLALAVCSLAASAWSTGGMKREGEVDEVAVASVNPPWSLNLLDKR